MELQQQQHVKESGALLLDNPALHSCPLAWRMQPCHTVKRLCAAFQCEPLNEVRGEGCRFNPESRKFEFRLYYPHARTVEVFIGGGRSQAQFEAGEAPHLPLLHNPLQLHGECWEGVAWFPVGLTTFSLLVDGHDVLSPFLPISVNRSRPSHFAERPPEELTELTHPEQLQAVFDKYTYLMRPGVARGNMVEDYVESTRTGRVEKVMLYLPHSYLHDTEGEQQRAKRYPVLYLQHGVGGNENQWPHFGKVQHILDNMIADKRCAEMIVVMCDGMLSLPQDPSDDTHTNWANKTRSTDSQFDQSYYCELLLQDVLPFVERNYRTLAEPDARAVAGFSMGGGQAAWLGLNPEVKLFSFVGVLAGLTRTASIQNLLGGNDRHLRELLKLKEEHKNSTLQEKRTATLHYFKQVIHNKVYFRCMGKEDSFFANFLEDDTFLEELGITKEDADIVIRKVYPNYTHSWEAMRAALQDFLPLLFK